MEAAPTSETSATSITSKNAATQERNYYYYYLVCEAIGTAATLGLLCQLRVIMKMIVEK
jgi:hypothetical protein